MKRLTIMLYSIINYTLGVAALVYLIAFLFNLFVPSSIDIGLEIVTADNAVLAVIINMVLITLFGLQHSVMARPKFKSWLTRFIPEAAERSTFMIATALVVFTLCFLWQPLPTVLWQADNEMTHYTLLVIGLSGWGLVLFSTFLINHFDLFGLRQAWLNLIGKKYTHLPFKTISLYKYVRHPIMTGVFIGIWFTPVMTIGHLLFATGMSIYILIGVYHEEKDLISAFGSRYQHYIGSTAKFFPSFKIGTSKGQRTID
ncbi:MAG: isoprenylcysteine carboxylmethyltransferase family protein [Gammaproteobacteria bacterium]|nr:isoprenylcysteine carboxylmethyltransferase family protein [Gammaproteobacteria bacterium]